MLSEPIMLSSRLLRTYSHDRSLKPHALGVPSVVPDPWAALDLVLSQSLHIEGRTSVHWAINATVDVQSHHGYRSTGESLEYLTSKIKLGTED